MTDSLCTHCGKRIVSAENVDCCGACHSTMELALWTERFRHLLPSAPELVLQWLAGDRTVLTDEAGDAMMMAARTEIEQRRRQKLTPLR